MVFSRDIRPFVLEEHPDASFGEIGRRIGERWRSATEGEKAVRLTPFDLLKYNHRDFARTSSFDESSRLNFPFLEIQ